MGICFTVFSDFHYKTQMPFAVRYMNEIMDHARTSGAEFVLQCGDFASDWSNSEEILDACLQNEYALPVYGTYGNHDTQVEADQFAFVTPRLTNDENVMWATANGKVNDGEITYYYADRGAYRLICLDTNHSYFPKEGKIKHAPPGMGEAPLENSPRHVLGERQLKWLADVLEDAVQKGLHCVVFSHAGFAGFKEGGWEFPAPSDDIKTVRALFRQANEKKSHTVILALNGHYHTDHAAMADNMVFFSVNSTICGWWDCEKHCPHPYGQPLYATVTIDDDFQISINGKNGCWAEGCAPGNSAQLACNGIRPQIASRIFRLK